MTHHFFTIDTLQFSKRLQKAGMNQEISEELAEAIKESASQSLDGLATKKDLQGLEFKLELKMEMMKKDIIIKLGSLMVIGISILAALIKL